MKSANIFGCMMLFVAVNSIAQEATIFRVSITDLPEFIDKEIYKYPSFVKAKVYFNNGDSAGGLLNYNYLLQSMQFIDAKNDTLVIANDKNVNYVIVGNDTSFHNNGYYELIATSSTAKLAGKYLLKNTGTQKSGAFGIPSVTTKIESQDETGGFNNRKLDVNEEYVFTKEKAYYISSTRDKFAEVNKKNLNKLFSKKIQMTI